MSNYTEYQVRAYANGDIEWRNTSGLIHREDGPAVEYADGTKVWYLNGKRHREDGPAAEHASGIKGWYLDGIYLTEQEHAEKTKPTKELTVGEIEQLLGYKIKVVK